MDEKMEPEKLYKFICGEIEASMISIQKGGEVNMENLDRNVRKFCEMVTRLPAAEAKKYDKKIESIISELTFIVERLTERKIDIGEQISGTSQRRKAQSAYGAAMLNSVSGAK